MRVISISVVCLLCLIGCGKLSPQKPNAYRAAATKEDQLRARIWWEASRKDLPSAGDRLKYAQERMQKANDEAYGKIKAAEKKAGEDDARLKALYRKLAIMADPTVEQVEPLDDLDIDEGDGL